MISSNLPSSCTANGEHISTEMGVTVDVGKSVNVAIAFGVADGEPFRETSTGCLVALPAQPVSRMAKTNPIAKPLNDLEINLSPVRFTDLWVKHSPI